MRLFGLIGYPLSHSFSKKYFTEKFAAEGISNCRYEIFPIEKISLLPALIEKEKELQGLNVTIPYKEKVIEYLLDYSPVVANINACNCIVVKNGKLFGHNTDVAGFEFTLKLKLRGHHKKALILGTGGAAKAVAYVLKKNGIEYLSVSRTASNETLTYTDLSPEIVKDNLLVINTSPVGMFPDVNIAPEFPYSAVTPEHLFIDLIYNPAKTKFLKMAEEKGAAIQNGSEMLVVQAEESWKIWNSEHV